jgi:hypothetical protein
MPAADTGERARQVSVLILRLARSRFPTMDIRIPGCHSETHPDRDSMAFFAAVSAGLRLG